MIFKHNSIYMLNTKQVPSSEAEQITFPSLINKKLVINSNSNNNQTLTLQQQYQERYHGDQTKT